MEKFNYLTRHQKLYEAAFLLKKRDYPHNIVSCMSSPYDLSVIYHMIKELYENPDCDYLVIEPTKEYSLGF